MNPADPVPDGGPSAGPGPETRPPEPCAAETGAAGAPSPEDLHAALLRADRSESLGPLAARLAEELNELLMRILGAAAAAAGRPGGNDPALPGPPGESPSTAPAGALAAIEAACLEAREVTRRIQAIARGGDGARRDVPARELLEDAVGTAGAAATAEITVGVPDGVDAVWVDPAQMGQAFRNLLRNALESLSPAPHRPRVQLRAANTVLPEGRIAGLPAGPYVEFEVRDNGRGIPAEDMEKVWEPFFTTKKHGAGLGLPTALAIVRRHGGQIGVDSETGVGTVFTVFLPQARPAGTVEARPAPSARFRTGRLLVVDDDAQLRAILGSLIESLDYKCDLARNGGEALACYKRYLDVGRPYDAVVLDLTLSGETGEGVFAQLRALDPDARVIATSGGAGEELSPRCIAQGFCGWLAKPFRLSELGQVLQTVLG